MGIRKRKIKADFIEDIIGTEPLSGTHDIRKQTAKVLEKDRAVREWKHQQILKKFKIQEEEALKELKKKEDLVLMNRRVEYLLYHLCEPKAFEYLNWLRNNNPKLLHMILYCIIPKKDMENLENYCARIFYLLKEGKKPPEKIKMDYIVRLMRAITGTKAKIEVERDGKRTEVSEVWKNNQEK